MPGKLRVIPHAKGQAFFIQAVCCLDSLASTTYTLFISNNRYDLYVNTPIHLQLQLAKNQPRTVILNDKNATFKMRFTIASVTFFGFRAVAAPALEEVIYDTMLKPMLSRMSSRNSGKIWIPLFITLTIIFLFIRVDLFHAAERRGIEPAVKPVESVKPAKPKQPPIYVPSVRKKNDVGLVVAKSGDEDIQWVEEFCEQLCVKFKG
jgi:hypothetical protein